MTALQLFKEAGALDQILSSVKNEWENGDYLKPMTIGAGAGGLGFGAGALLGKGEAGESGGDKTKRVLSQMLKGTALGGLAGGAYGGLKHLSRDFIGGKDGDTPKAKDDPQGDRQLTEGKKPEKDEPVWGAQDYINKHPVESRAVATTAGGAVGAGAGASSGAVAEKLLNPDRIANTESRLTDYNDIKKAVKPGEGKVFDVIKELAKAPQTPPVSPSGVPSSSGSPILDMYGNPIHTPHAPTPPPIPYRLKATDLATHLGGGYSSRAAGSIAQQAVQALTAQSATNKYIQAPGANDALDLAKALAANGADPALKGLTDIPQAKSWWNPAGATKGPVEFGNLDAIAEGEKALAKARSPFSRYGAKGGILGLLGGAGLGAYMSRGDGAPTAPPGEAPKLPDNKQINMGDWGTNPSWSLGLGGK